MCYNIDGDKMKKIILVMLLMITSGCSTKTVDSDIEKMSKYNSLYVDCLNNADFKLKSDNFNIELDFTQMDNGYNYYIVIDEPKIAMYDVEAIVIENLMNYNEIDMMPTVGIFESGEYNLVPYQTNKQKNFYGGIVISGDTLVENVDLYALVTWKDVTMTKQFKEYILITDAVNKVDVEDKVQVNEIDKIDNESTNG